MTKRSDAGGLVRAADEHAPCPLVCTSNAAIASATPARNMSGRDLLLLFRCGKRVMFHALLAGRVDAILHELGAVNRRMPGGFERSEEIDLDVFYGLAVRKGNAELLSVVNQTLHDAVQDGTWATLYWRWVRLAPPTSGLIR
jgi:ABC-type amino acid transport substrate-binding protein